MNRCQHLLCKLAEESNEVGQRALKTAYFGLDEVYEGQTNREMLIGELQDLLAIVGMLNEEYALGFHLVSNKTHEAILEKKAKVNHYADYSESLGLLRKEDRRG
jgi:hypothetical protein